MNVLDQAIYAKLAADTGAGGVANSSTGATGGIYQLVAPENAALPRLHFQELLDTPLYTNQTLVADHCYYQFTVFAVSGNEAGAVTAGRLAERARSILTDPASMPITGKTLLYSRFERSIPALAEPDGTRIIYSKGFILEVWLA